MDKTQSPDSKVYQHTVLDNGLRIVSCKIPHAQSVSIGIYIGAGSRYETLENAGISHFVEHMAFKGTRSRPKPEEISGTIESMGGILNAGTEQELTVYWCKVAQSHFKESLSLLLDMIRNSLFDKESIEKERMVVIEELNMIYDYPNYRVEALVDELLWPNHALGRDIGGTKGSVARITRDAMLGYMDSHYIPSNTVISVAGNISHSQITSEVTQITSDWHAKASPEWKPFLEHTPGPRFKLEYRKTEQLHLSIAVPGVSLRHPHKYVLDLLSIILGEGMTSRLFVEVRENRGLAYDIRSDVTYFKDCGALIVTAGVDPKRIYDTTSIILEQMSSMRDSVTLIELERAKQQAIGRMMLRLEDTREVSSWMGNQELLTNEVLNTEDVIKHISAVTSHEINQIAKDILSTQALTMALVGPCRGRQRLQNMLKL